MSKFASRYPDRAIGAGLLLLRLAAAAIAFALLAGRSAFPLFPAMTMPLAVAVPLALIAGAATRPAALLLLPIVVVTDACPGPGAADVLAIGHAGLCMALVLLGPGAYSIDAKMFGRRVILLESRPPDRGDGH